MWNFSVLSLLHFSVVSLIYWIGIIHPIHKVALLMVSVIFLSFLELWTKMHKWWCSKHSMKCNEIMKIHQWLHWRKHPVIMLKDTPYFFCLWWLTFDFQEFAWLILFSTDDSRFKGNNLAALFLFLLQGKILLTYYYIFIIHNIDLWFMFILNFWGFAELVW
jgi:hypothetical protein